MLLRLSHRMSKTAGQRAFSVSGRCLDGLMSSQPVDHLHPVVDFAHRLRERLDSVAKVPLWSMTEEQQRDALTTLAHAEAQLDALKLGLLAEADRSGATTDSGARSAADWLATE